MIRNTCPKAGTPSPPPARAGPAPATAAEKVTATAASAVIIRHRCRRIPLSPALHSRHSRGVQAGKQPREPDRKDADCHQHDPGGLAERLPVAPELLGEDDRR